VRGSGPLQWLSSSAAREGWIAAVILALAVASFVRPASGWQGKQKPPEEPSSNSEEARAQDEGTYDPGRASNDIEVGTYYMHKGDIEAAIARFEDAVHAQPNSGKARLLLGEAYEKNGEREAAVKSYQTYLKMYPKAPDAEKIQKKIEKLSVRSK
jgi:Tfp pilus assembly protein PilF